MGPKASLRKDEAFSSTDVQGKRGTRRSTHETNSKTKLGKGKRVIEKKTRNLLRSRETRQKKEDVTQPSKKTRKIANILYKHSQNKKALLKDLHRQS